MAGQRGINQIKGFSLIEVLVAMSILMLVLLPVYTTIFQTNRANIENQGKLTALHLAKAKIEEIKALGWLEFKALYLADPAYPTEIEPLPFGPEYMVDPQRDFTYRVKVWPGETNLSYTIEATVYYKEAGKEKWQTLYTEKCRR
ncbi:type IV pilus modification PilV family protein [Desulfotomaculum sp. 1211_IL3151]|uniref:type IV pilus modification PilV family protein n=1 Tax=Desulfotomaculum sp. 1211_IL3151 TaxID=3084055 RepID=UPI002FDA47C8